MTTQVTSILYPVRDLDGAKAIFTTLFGVEPMADSPYYVGYDVNGLQIGLVPNGHDDGMTGPLPYVQVEDIERAIADLLAVGATVSSPVRDIGPGGIVAVVQDAEGNSIGLIQAPS